MIDERRLGAHEESGGARERDRQSREREIQITATAHCRQAGSNADRHALVALCISEGAFVRRLGAWGESQIPGSFDPATASTIGTPPLVEGCGLAL